MPQPPPDQRAAINPYAAPRAFAPPPRRPRTGREARLLWSVLCCAQMAFTIIAIVAAFVNIESITVSGPLLSLLGCGIALAAGLGGGSGFQRIAATLFGLSAPAISFFCLMLILLMDWGPSRAQQPVSVIALLYGTVAGALCFGVLLSHFRSAANDAGRHADRLTGRPDFPSTRGPS